VIIFLSGYDPPATAMPEGFFIHAQAGPAFPVGTDNALPETEALLFSVKISFPELWRFDAVCINYLYEYKSFVQCA